MTVARAAATAGSTRGRRAESTATTPPGRAAVVLPAGLRALGARGGDEEHGRAAGERARAIGGACRRTERHGR
jgi:hypothetical protein